MPTLDPALVLDAAEESPLVPARWDDVERAARDLIAQQDFRRAQVVYDRAIALCPLPARRLGLLKAAAVVAKDHLGDVESAIKYLRAIVDVDPTDARTAAALDELLAATGRPPLRSR